MDGTKKLILDTALDMISVRGFDSVSVRDICGKVGIKESSLYYHFTNKRAILDTLVDNFRDMSESMYRSLYDSLGNVASFSPEKMVALTLKYYTDYLNGDEFNKLIHIMHIEQNNSDDIAALYTTMLFEWPTSIFKLCFELLIKSGTFPNISADSLAAIYCSVIYSVYFEQASSRIPVRDAVGILYNRLLFLFSIF